MKVLELNSITKYDFMANALTFVAFGDLEEAIISAYKHLENVYDDGVRLDILLFVAKIYSKMGEVEASSNVLFRLLGMRRDEGRIYALLAYNFYRAGDTESGNLYNLMTRDWNAKHGNVLELDDEYDRELVVEREKVKVKCDNGETINRAWNYAFSGNADEARTLIMTLPSSNNVDKFELLTALDIMEKRTSAKTDEMIDEILSHDIDPNNLLREVYILERAGNFTAIVKLLERAISEKLCTARLAYIYAVALNNTGNRELALRVLERLDGAYSYVYPYISATKYFIESSERVYIPIYHDSTTADNLNIMRDSMALKAIMSHEMLDNVSLNMVRGMYEAGVVNSEVKRATRELVRTTYGENILKDILLDNTVRTAKMRLHIARELLRKNHYAMLVYENMVNEAHCTLTNEMSETERRDMLDTTAFKLVAGMD